MNIIRLDTRDMKGAHDKTFYYLRFPAATVMLGYFDSKAGGVWKVADKVYSCSGGATWGVETPWEGFAHDSFQLKLKDSAKRVQRMLEEDFLQHDTLFVNGATWVKVQDRVKTALGRVEKIVGLDDAIKEMWEDGPVTVNADTTADAHCYGDQITGGVAGPPPWVTTTTWQFPENPPIGAGD